MGDPVSRGQTGTNRGGRTMQNSARRPMKARLRYKVGVLFTFLSGAAILFENFSEEPEIHQLC